MKYFLGMDPDIRNFTVACVDEHGAPVALFIESNKKTSDKKRDIVALSAIANKAVFKFTYLYPHASFDMAIEAQNITYTGKRNDTPPQDILDLAYVSGIGVGVFQAWCAKSGTCTLVSPQKWKGSVPKKIHQSRILKKLGCVCEMAGGKSPYPYPLKGMEGLRVLGKGKVNMSDWKDATDSFGLALYALGLYKKPNEGEKYDYCLPNQHRR